MKLTGRNAVVSGLLFFILIIVILINIAIYISGPMRKYEYDQALITNKITDKYKYIHSIKRHSFQYVIYVGEGKYSYYWFDAKAKLLLHRNKEDLQFNEVKAIAKERYRINDARITLGYGYKNAVYVIHKEANQEIYLDLDTLQEVGRLEANT